MIVSHTWLAEHINDPNIVILDSRGNVAYSYANIPNSQPLGIEKVVKTNQHGANIFTQLKIAGYENVRLYDGSIVDWAGRRLPLA
jgi:thiosulfate/3-mercaptopyruvate sulfurtransferase